MSLNTIYKEHAKKRALAEKKDVMLNFLRVNIQDQMTEEII